MLRAVGAPCLPRPNYTRVSTSPRYPKYHPFRSTVGNPAPSGLAVSVPPSSFAGSRSRPIPLPPAVEANDPGVPLCAPPVLVTVRTTSVGRKASCTVGVAIDGDSFGQARCVICPARPGFLVLHVSCVEIHGPVWRSTGRHGATVSPPRTSNMRWLTRSPGSSSVTRVELGHLGRAGRRSAALPAGRT